MKTIEERAREYSDRHKIIENKYFKGYNYNIAEKYDTEKFAYEAGATDQKAIDDAKAKEAFNKVCGWLYNYPWFNEVADEFIKALEEEK